MIRSLKPAPKQRPLGRINGRTAAVVASMLVCPLLINWAHADERKQDPVKAHAALLTGTLGDYGRVTAASSKARERKFTINRPEIQIESALISTSKTSVDNAEISIGARNVSILNGAIKVDQISQTAKLENDKPLTKTQILGLTIGSTRYERIEKRTAFDIPGLGVLSIGGDSALTLKTMSDANGQIPSDSTISIAAVSIIPKVDDSLDEDAVFTISESGEDKHQKPRSNNLPRRKPPKVSKRLSSRRFAFPVHGPASVADDFGAFRASTGSHEGNDIFAPLGTPIVAVADGHLQKVGTLPISGNRLWVISDAGDGFFYAHLSAFAADARNGKRVEAGDVIGFVGNTGDAAPTPPHLHFEIHPGNQERGIDPHEILMAWKGRSDAPASAWASDGGGVSGPNTSSAQTGPLVQLKDFIAEG